MRWADLAGRPHGDLAASGRPFVFLHGLTFDHRMWDPVLEALPGSHPAIAFDLPGHGGSPALPHHNLEAVADAIHEAVLDACLTAPVVVGHSIGGPIASVYAIKYPSAAIVTVDQPVPVAPFAQLVRSLADRLAPGSFAQTWEMFRESMQIELVPASARPLLAAGEAATREQVLSYWVELLGRTPRTLRAGSRSSLARRVRPPAISRTARPRSGSGGARVPRRPPASRRDRGLAGRPPLPASRRSGSLRGDAHRPRGRLAGRRAALDLRAPAEIQPDELAGAQAMPSFGRTLRRW